MAVSSSFVNERLLLILCRDLGPGTFIEVRKLLPLLVEASPEHPSFHTVALGLLFSGAFQARLRSGSIR